MKVAVMQPYFLPYLGYWQLLACVDRFVLFDDVHFPKKGYVNRNSMLDRGEPRRFTLALKKASQNKLINEIEVGDNRRQVYASLLQAYRQAPFVDAVEPLLRQLVLNPENNLARYVGRSIMLLADHLGLDAEILYSSDIDKPAGLRCQEKVIDLVRRMEADHYVNAIGGRELYQPQRFAEAGLKLSFLQPRLRAYDQGGAPFVPNLSVVDALMFNSPKQVRAMLDDYELIAGDRSITAAAMLSADQLLPDERERNHG